MGPNQAMSLGEYFQQRVMATFVIRCRFPLGPYFWSHCLHTTPISQQILVNLPTTLDIVLVEFSSSLM